MDRASIDLEMKSWPPNLNFLITVHFVIDLVVNVARVSEIDSLH